MDNKKRRPIICRTKPNLNKTFKEDTKAIEVVQVQVSLMVGDHTIMHILVQITLLLQVLLTTNMEVLQIGVHNSNKLSQIECQRCKILKHSLCRYPSQNRRTLDAILPRKGPITRAMSKMLQHDWARAAAQGPSVLMNLSLDFSAHGPRLGPLFSVNIRIGFSSFRLVGYPTN